MSANSPTYSCEGGGTPLINSTTPYCIVPGGSVICETVSSNACGEADDDDRSKRMEYCCAQSGQGDVELEPDCYSWCHVDVQVGSGDEFQSALQTATDKFAYCLSHGDNATIPTGMVCNEGTNFTQPAASATITSTSSFGMQSHEATSVIGSGGISETSNNLAAVATRTGGVKAAGLVGALLAAGVIGGAL